MNYWLNFLQKYSNEEYYGIHRKKTKIVFEPKPYGAILRIFELSESVASASTATPFLRVLMFFPLDLAVRTTDGVL